MAKSGVRIKLNRAGVRQLLRSDDMMAVCKAEAEAVRSRLGKGYEVNTHVGRNRVNAEVAAVSIAARVDNAAHNTLLRALGGKK